MPRTFPTLPTFAEDDPVMIANFLHPSRDAVALLGLGLAQRNVPMGGSMIVGIVAEATGDVILPEWRPVRVDNSNNQISGSANVIVRCRFLVRVSNGAITVTPKVYNITDAGAATISGGAACSATSADYDGTNQQQTITLTLPSGVKDFQGRLTIAGTPAAGYQCWGVAIFDCFING